MRRTGIVARALAVPALALVAAGALPARGEEIVTVWGDLAGDPVVMRHGFLHGLRSPAVLDDHLVDGLRPAFWRLSTTEALLAADRHGAAITFVLSDPYAWYKGGYPNAKPWLDWQEFEQFLLEYLTALRDTFPGIHVEYWDLWNEPDHPFFWSGTYEQLLETFARAHDVVKTVHPGARFVGPSISWLRPDGSGVETVVDFLADLDAAYGIRLDAVSWHENGGAFHGGPRPEQIVPDAYYIRTRLAQSFPPSYTPELHVNEFTGTQEHLSPGWNVGYYYYLEEAGIDAAMRSCWDVYSGPPVRPWSDCWAGLDGMFLDDGETPQPAYFAVKGVADMAGELRLRSSTTDPTTVLLASRDEASQRIRILVGRYWHSGPADVRIRFVGYPWPADLVRVQVRRIPNDPGFYEDPPHALPLASGPILVSSDLVGVAGGQFDVPLDGFDDGDAYTVTILPASPPPGVPAAGRLALALLALVLGAAAWLAVSRSGKRRPV